MNYTVVGVFNSGEEAQYAVNQLKNSNFSNSNIDLSARMSDNDDRHNESSISSFFDSIFGDDDDDKKEAYCAVAQDKAIVTVHADTKEKAQKALNILDTSGALDIDNEYKKLGKTRNTNTTGQQSAKVIEEELEVGKKTVETGGARLRSYLVEKPVEEKVRLRVEHVFVERKPVNRPATEADFAAFNEGSIEVTEHAEKAVVGKTAQVVEEVSVGKTAEQVTETIHDTVRETKVEVEKVGNETDLSKKKKYATETV